MKLTFISLAAISFYLSEGRFPCPEVRNISVVVGRTAALYCDIHNEFLFNVSFHKNLTFVRKGEDKVLIYQTYKRGHTTVFDRPGINYVGRVDKIYNTMSLVTLRHVTEDDDGTYSCDWSTEPGIPGCEIHEARFLLRVIAPVRNIRAEVTSPVIEGDGCHFRCKADGTPPIRYAWRKLGGKIPDDANRWRHGSVELTGVTRSLAGRYICTADNNAHAPMESNTVDLTVFYPPSYVDLKSSSQNQTLPENTKVTLTCTVYGGFPSPDVTIYRNHSEALNDSGLNMATWQLTKTDDNVPFGCLATGGGIKAAVSSHPVVFRVLYSPVLDLDLGYESDIGVISSSDGETAVLRIQVKARPPPTFKWTRLINTEHQPLLKKCEVNSTGLQSALIIPSVTSQDYVTYSCLVRNRMGKADFTFLLQPKRSQSIAVIAAIAGSSSVVFLVIAALVILKIRLSYTDKNSTSGRSDGRSDLQIVSSIEDHVMNPAGSNVTYDWTMPRDPTDHVYRVCYDHVRNCDHVTPPWRYDVNGNAQYLNLSSDSQIYV